MTATWIQKVRTVLPFAATALFVAAVVLLTRRVRSQGLESIQHALESTRASDVGAAALLSALSYATLTLVDTLAIRTVARRRRVTYPRIALTSFTALSLGHVVGLAALSSGTIRYRLYSCFGLTEGDVARVLVFTTTTIALGLAFPLGLGTLVRPDLMADFSGLPAWLTVSVGAAALALVGGYLFLVARSDGSLAARGHRYPLPSLRAALLQVAVGAANFFLVAATLHQLLDPDVSFLAFASFYCAANLMGILSHIPGGLGVLEVVLIAAAPGADTVSALILFRLVYYVAPFVLGAVLYGGFELLGSKSPISLENDARHDA